MNIRLCLLWFLYKFFSWRKLLRSIIVQARKTTIPLNYWSFTTVNAGSSNITTTVHLLKQNWIYFSNVFGNTTVYFVSVKNHILCMNIKYNWKHGEASCSKYINNESINTFIKYAWPTPEVWQQGLGKNTKAMFTYYVGGGEVFFRTGYSSQTLFFLFNLCMVLTDYLI